MRRTVSTRRAVVLVLFGLVLATATVTDIPLLHRADAPVAAGSRTSDVLADLPLSFEPVGEGRFVSRGPGYSLALTAAEAVVGVRGGTFRLRPAGPTADPAARLVAAEPLGGTVTRLTGDDPSRWRAGLSTFARVEVRQVWPGVDMVWHGDQRRLEHDMVVSPGVDPAVVALDVEGARSLALGPDGDLVLDLGATTARLARPVVYQDVAGDRRQVAGDFTLLGPSRIGFRLGAYDSSLPLVIDPVLVTSTFLGGMGGDSGYAIAVDPQGNTYVTGSTESADFPTSAPLQPALADAGGAPASDVFVSKLSADGSRLIWSTYLGGRGRDTGYAVAVGADGAVYVGGVTESSDFPQARAVQTAYGGGASDAFMAKIAANGASVEWSTFVGGTQTDRARGLAVDAGGSAYLTGSTNSADFPAVRPQQPGPFGADLDAFLVKVPSAGGGLAFATRLGGANDDHGLAVAVDTQGSAFVTGDTLSPAFPTVRPLQPSSGGSAGGVAGSFADAFVAKYNPAGSALVYSTFLGGGDVDQGTAIAVDASGAAYVAGNTSSSNFPTVGPLQAAKGNEPDAFVSKVDPAGAALVYSTYFGGSGAEGANAIAVDRAGAAHVVGTTGSADWPTTKAVQAARGGGDDAFVLKLDSTGRGPLYSSYLGGREAESGMGVAVDTEGVVHVLGLTGSSDFPSVEPFTGSRPPAGGDAFVAMVNVVDAGATPAAPAAPASQSSSTSSHDRRVRMLFALTVALLLAAVLQTLYLRRRAPAAAGPAPRAKPTPGASATPGLKMLDSAAPGAKKSGATAKAPMAPRSSRTPKTRGGPKGGPGQKSGGPQKKGGARKQVGRPEPVVDPSATVSVPEAAELPDDGGPPTMATPLPRVKPQEPAIAHLLEEDLWGADVSRPGETAAGSEEGRAPEDVGEAGASVAAPHTGRLDHAQPAPEGAPIDTGSTPAVTPQDPSEPAPAIPPVPAEELSFWDLFPEDLPPVRPPAFPAEDLLAGKLALPEGPDSAAERLVGAAADDGDTVTARAPAEAPPQVTPQPQQQSEWPPRPPEAEAEAEIVIAELLDGPLPTGLRPSAESPWAPPPDGDFFIDDLLAQPGSERDAKATSEPDDETHVAAAAQGPSKEEQARIAADQARRRRSRRGGGRKNPPGGG